MRKIIISIVFIASLISVQAQGCRSVNKGISAVNLNKIDDAQTHFENAEKNIKEAEDRDQPLEAKCYAKYYYGSGHVALEQANRVYKEDLKTTVELLDKAQEFFSKFLLLSCEDKSFTAKTKADLEAVANQQKNIAVDYYNKADYETALKLLEKAIVNKEKLGTNHLDLHAYQNASLIASASGNFEKAIEYIDVLIQNPQLKINNNVNNQEQNLTRKANYLLRLGNFEKALSVLDSASLIFPESVLIKREKLKIFSELNDDDSLMDLLEELTKTVKDDVQFFTILGRIYTKKGYSDKAYEAYHSAMEIDSKNKYALFGMGAYYVNKSNEIAANYNGVGKLASNNASKSSTIEEQNKNFDKAIYFFNKYLELDPGDKEALDALKKIYIAKGDEEKVTEINNQLIKD